MKEIRAFTILAQQRHNRLQQRRCDTTWEVTRTTTCDPMYSFAND
jgi:hypothetical protein